MHGLMQRRIALDDLLRDFPISFAKTTCSFFYALVYSALDSWTDPDNMAVLNNLALTEIKLGQFRDALAHWKAAAALGFDQRVTNNLGRLINQAGKRRISADMTDPLNDPTTAHRAQHEAGEIAAEHKPGHGRIKVLECHPQGVELLIAEIARLEN